MKIIKFFVVLLILMFSIAQAEEVKLVRVIDGDTFVIEPDIRVRLIGVDTPELNLSKGKNAKPEPYALKAKSYTKQKLEKATKIRLESDGQKYGKYNRRMALVYVTGKDKKEILLNEYLLEQGLAKFEAQYSYSKEMKERFKKAEQKAKENNRNLWRRFR
jgi:micrococcal nuclease